jgi:hypothetical protein
MVALSRPMTSLALLCLMGGSAMGQLPYEEFRCGVLEAQSGQGDECLLFALTGVSYVLDNYGGYGAGDTVLVYGTTDGIQVSTCGYYYATIHVETIHECRGFDFGCGTLTSDGEWCWYFDSWRYGPCLVSSWGGYELGDTVRVYGSLDEECYTWCTPTGCILVDSVTTCTDTPPAVDASTWGKVKSYFR